MSEPSAAATTTRVAVLLRHDLPVILGLTGLAVAQPLLDLFGRNPEFFVAKDASARDVILFGVAVTFLLPAVLMAIEAVAFLVARPVGRIVHSLFVGLLGAALALTILRQLELDATVVVLVLGGVAGLLLAVGERRWRGLEMVLRVLVVAPFLFLAFYLGLSSSSRLIWESEAEVATNVEVGRDAPVVEIVFDEFPLASILSADGTINAERFPNFARLADQSSWFRNASAVSWQTEHSVPSILTGNEPSDREIATSFDHPRNLFTLLGASYEMNVSEPITSLCPSSVCRASVAAQASPSPGLRQSLVDASVVFGHAVLPSGLRSRLPSIAHSWGNFVEPAAGEERAVRVDAAAAPRSGGDRTAEEFANFARWAELGVAGQSPPAQGAIAEQLVASASRPGDARLSFAQVILPHYPWQMAPSGRRYTSRADLASYTERGNWADDEWSVRQAQQQHLMQVGYADTLVGQLIDEMTAAGTWEEALVVVVADHGVSFTPGEPQRQPTDANLAEIYRVPLFVKAPGQGVGDGETRDDNARLLDVLPTMVDALDLQTDWEFDGRSLFGNEPEPEDKEVFVDPDRETIPVGQRGLLEVVARNDDRFGRDPGWRGVFAVGHRGGAVGTPVSSLPTDATTPLQWSIDQEDALAAVDQTTGFVPLLLSGRLRVPPGAEVPDTMLVAVDGVVAGVAGGFSGFGENLTFSALLDESAVSDGRNTLQVLVPSGTGDATTYAVAERLDQPAYRLTRDALEPAGDDEVEIPVGEPSDDLRLEVESAFQDDQTLALKGWAADLAAGELPDAVLVFVDGEQVGVAGQRVRPDLATTLGDAFAGAGFEKVVGSELAPRRSDIEVVAIFGDRAVRAEVQPDR